MGELFVELSHGPSGEIRTHGLMVPNGHQKIFLTIFAYFQPFSIVFFFLCNFRVSHFPAIPRASMECSVVKQ